jgi:hypothetical protein
MLVKLEQVIRRECSSGVQCSRLQSQVLAHCIKDCRDCNRDAVASVLGSCAIEGHESAMNLIRATCDHTDNDDELTDMFAELGPPPPPPPPCTMLQTAIAEGCIENCGKQPEVSETETIRLCLTLISYICGRNCAKCPW